MYRRILVPVDGSASSNLGLQHALKLAEDQHARVRLLNVVDEMAVLPMKFRADLIVMGTHGRRGLNRLLLGSDAERVLRSAQVPVLLVKGNGVSSRRCSSNGTLPSISSSSRAQRSRDRVPGGTPAVASASKFARP